MKPTREPLKIPHTDEDRVWAGHPVKHPEEVWEKLYLAGRPRTPWTTFEVQCDEPMCLDLDHIKVITPTRLEYPKNTCTYCGVRSGTRDHLISRTWTGPSRARQHIITVPACGQCNSILNDIAVRSIDGRRAHVQRRLAEKKFKVLAYESRREVELAEYGPNLRSVMESAAQEREHLEARLSWPDDMDCDLRYLQKSGIEHPLDTGLLEYTPEMAALEREQNLKEATRAAKMKRQSLTMAR